MTQRLHGVLAKACLAVLLPGASAASAAEWRWQSGASLFAQAETNPRLQEDTQQDVVGGSAEVRLQLQRRTEIQTLHVDAVVQSRRYSQDVSLDRNEYRIASDFTRSGERHQLALRGTISRDTTLNRELGTTGLSQVNLRRQLLDVSFSPTVVLGERLTASGSINYQQIHYLSNANFELVDYRYRSAAAQVGYQYSERTTVSMIASTDRLDSDRADLGTDNYYAVLQLRHAWSPAWDFTASAGPSWVESSGVRDSGSRYSVALTHKGQYQAVTLYANRAAAPAGRGLLTRRDLAGISVSRQLGEFFDITVGANHQRSRDIFPVLGLTFSDVRYVRAEMGFGWRFAEDWRLGFSAGGSRQHIIQFNDKARNFDARVTLAWNRSSDLG